MKQAEKSGSPRSQEEGSCLLYVSRQMARLLTASKAGHDLASCAYAYILRAGRCVRAAERTYYCPATSEATALRGRQHAYLGRVGHRE
jgi:hypothetical protein